MARAALPAAIMLFMSAIVTLGDGGALHAQRRDLMQEDAERDALGQAREG